MIPEHGCDEWARDQPDRPQHHAPASNDRFAQVHEVPRPDGPLRPSCNG
jgi:hypothetical protein